jgi:hypothetical protein
MDRRQGVFPNGRYRDIATGLFMAHRAIIDIMANSALRVETNEKAAPIRAARVVVCPQCDAQLLFHRSRTPEIDACGFETCRLVCSECAASLAGVIDPHDDAVLVSALPS